MLDAFNHNNDILYMYNISSFSKRVTGFISIREWDWNSIYQMKTVHIVLCTFEPWEFDGYLVPNDGSGKAEDLLEN